MKCPDCEIRQISTHDVHLMKALLHLFSDVSHTPKNYAGECPSDRYLQDLLGGDSFIALVALKDNQVVGGLAAYDLKMFEQERHQIYIHDFAVACSHRRNGIATRLLDALKQLAVDRGASAILGRAETGPDDEAAISLYTKLGDWASVLQFDISVPTTSPH